MKGTFFRKILIGIIGLGAVSGTTTAVAATLETSGKGNMISNQTHYYHGRWYNEDVLIYEKDYARGEKIEYDGEAPTKRDYETDDIYVFSGWDLTGDNIPEIFPNSSIYSAYTNFNARACYKRLPENLLEKIDWEKLLNLLMDKNIDLEALLSRLGLSPEDIARLLSLTTLSVKSSVSGPTYLRTESFGNYNSKKNGWDDAPFYDLSKISEGSVNPLQYTAYKCSQLASNPLFASYSIQGDYEFEYKKTGNKYPTIAFELKNDQRVASDSYSVNSINSDNKYSTKGFALVPCTEQTVLIGLTTNYGNPAIEEDEQKYRAYVREQYLSVDDNYKNYFINLNNNYINAPTNNVGQAVTLLTNYFTKSFKINLSHNAFPKKDDPLIYFMNNAKEAESAYFATATTLFLRSLGYPARYTQGYLAAIANPDEWTDVSSLQAYSWCEVYVDGIGWMNADTAMYLVAAAFTSMGVTPPGDDTMNMNNKGINKELIRLECGEGTKNEIIGGTEFDYDKDLDLVAVFSDGVTETKEHVKPSKTMPVNTSQTKGPYTVRPTAFYTYLDTTKYLRYDLNVVPLMLKEFSVFNDETYYPYSLISDDDFYIKGLTNDGKSRNFNFFSREFLYHDPIPENPDPGVYPIKFYYKFEWGLNGEYDIIESVYDLHINEPLVITKIVPNNILTDTFYIGKEHDLFNKTFTVYYNNGDFDTNYRLKEEDIIDPSGLDLVFPGTFTSIIQPNPECEPYYYSFEVKENILVDISVEVLNNKFFVIDEDTEVKESDLIITSYYLDGSKLENAEATNFINHEVLNTEGTKTVFLTHTETFKFAGDISFTEEFEIEVFYLENIEFTCLDDYGITIDKGFELTQEHLDSVSLYVSYNNSKYNETFTGSDKRLTFDTSEVDTDTIGVYYVNCEFKYSIYKEPVSIKIKVRVVGVEYIKGYLPNKPEKVYTDHTYNILDWNIYIDVHISYDGENFVDDKVYFGDPNLSVSLMQPLEFNEAKEYPVIFSYNYLGTIYEDEINLLVELRDIKEVDFDFVDLVDKHIYDGDTLDFKSVTATATYNDDTTETFYEWSPNVSHIDEIVSSKDSIIEHKVTFTLTNGDKTYSDYFAYYVELPNSLAYNSLNGIKLFDITTGNFDFFSNSEAFLNYPTLEKQFVPVWNLTFEYKNEKVLGKNVVEVSYKYSADLTLNTTVEVELYKTILDVKLSDEVYCEGDYITKYPYTASVTYEVGENCQKLESKENVDVRLVTPNSQLDAGENNFIFEYRENNLAINDTVTVDAYRLVDFIVDSSDFTVEYLRGDKSPENSDYKKLKFKEVLKSDITGDTIERDVDFNDVWITNYVDTSTFGEKQITIFLNRGKTTKFKTIDYVVKEPRITKFEIDTSACTNLTANELINGGLSKNLNSDGYTYKVTYENGLVEIYDYSSNPTNFTLNISKGFNDDEQDYLAPGTYKDILTITHPYGDKTQSETTDSVTITYEIIKNNINGLLLDTSGCTKIFYKNYQGGNDQTFNYDNLVVLVDCDYIDSALDKGNIYFINEKQYLVLNNWEQLVSKNDITFSELGTYTFTINYSGFSASYEVEYKLDEISKITLKYDGKSDSITILEGSSFDIDNVNANGYYLSDISNSKPQIISMANLVLPYDEPDLSTYIDDSPIPLTLKFTVGDKTITSEVFNFYLRAKSYDYQEFEINPVTISVDIGDDSALVEKINSIIVKGKNDYGKDVLILDEDYTIDYSNVDINTADTYLAYISFTDSKYWNITSVVTINVVDNVRVDNISYTGNNVFERGSNQIISDDEIFMLYKINVEDHSFNLPNFGSGSFEYQNHTYDLMVLVTTINDQPDTSRIGNFTFEILVTYLFDGECFTTTVVVEYQVI